MEFSKNSFFKFKKQKEIIIQLIFNLHVFLAKLYSNLNYDIFFSAIERPGHDPGAVESVFFSQKDFKFFKFKYIPNRIKKNLTILKMV